MDWRDDWRSTAVRLNAWQETARAYVRGHGLLADQWSLDAVADELVKEAHGLILRMARLPIPEPFRSAVGNAHIRLGRVTRMVTGPSGVMHQLLVLHSMRAPIDEAFLSTEAPRRALVERAFLHLNRTLAIDEDIRRRWNDGFTHETRCEKLGALHLLSHGVYAFKADASSGRTDLMLGAPLALSEDVQAAAAMVLTEWKLVRDRDDPAVKAAEGLAQARRYASVELGGFELRSTRYVVLVSATPVATPATVHDGDVTFRYINVAITRRTPSAESRATP